MTQEATPEPETARLQWVEALTSGHAAEAWEMMSTDARARWADTADFARWYERYAAELLVQVMTSQEIEPRHTVNVGRVALVRQGGAWRVDSTGFESGARTPRSALLAFRALLVEGLGRGVVSRRLLNAADEVLAAGDTVFHVFSNYAEARLPGGVSFVLTKVGERWQVESWTVPRLESSGPAPR